MAIDVFEPGRRNKHLSYLLREALFGRSVGPVVPDLDERFALKSTTKIDGSTSPVLRSECEFWRVNRINGTSDRSCRRPLVSSSIR